MFVSDSESKMNRVHYFTLHYNANKF